MVPSKVGESLVLVLCVAGAESDIDICRGDGQHTSDDPTRSARSTKNYGDNDKTPFFELLVVDSGQQSWTEGVYGK